VLRHARRQLAVAAVAGLATRRHARHSSSETNLRNGSRIARAGAAGKKRDRSPLLKLFSGVKYIQFF
jgi:hypothetical protein